MKQESGMTVKADGDWTLGRLVEGECWREIDHPAYRKALRVRLAPHDGEFTMSDHRARAILFLLNRTEADRRTTWHRPVLMRSSNGQANRITLALCGERSESATSNLLASTGTNAGTT